MELNRTYVLKYNIPRFGSMLIILRENTMTVLAFLGKSKTC